MQRFEYEVEQSWRPLKEYEYDFRERVENGWRLVTIVKSGKEDFLTYWERPFNG